MTKREKVIRGLETCVQCMSSKDCDGCLYEGERTYAVSCGDVLMADALALLKEQEAVEPKIFQSEDFLWSQWYICGACEYPVDPGDKFCRKCGRPIKWEQKQWAAMPRWIPVTERLPENYQSVIVHRDDGGIFIWEYFGESPTEECWIDDHSNVYSTYTVTHWMLLPEPPKGEDDGESTK